MLHERHERAEAEMSLEESYERFCAPYTARAVLMVDVRSHQDLLSLDAEAEAQMVDSPTLGMVVCHFCCARGVIIHVISLSTPGFTPCSWQVPGMEGVAPCC